MSAEHLIQSNIDDTVTQMKFYPSENFNILATGGWDKQIRIFNINAKITSISNILDNDEKAEISSEFKTSIQHQSPILTLDWLYNSDKIITGCGDGSVNIVDFQKNNLQKIGQHNSLVKEVISYKEMPNIIFSGGCDGAVNIWDIRSNGINPIQSCQLKNKVFSMCLGGNLLVVSLSQCVSGYFNLSNLQKGKFSPEILYMSLLKDPLTRVSMLKNNIGYIQGCIGGRVTVKYIDLYKKLVIDENKALKDENDFSFKCHRDFSYGNDTAKLYPINDICVNPKYGSVCTVGGDGQYSLWNIEKQSKIGERYNLNIVTNNDKTPLTACCYNQCGNILAFSSGYDWSLGIREASKYRPPRIHVRFLTKNLRNKSD